MAFFKPVPLLVAAALAVPVQAHDASHHAGQDAAEPPAAIPFMEKQIALPQMQLIDQRADSHALLGDLLAAHRVVINFSYTECDSICPMSNATMAALDAMWADGEGPLLLTISIDPLRDTPDRLAQAAETFGASPRWIWLTGHPADIDSLLSSFGLSVPDIEDHDPAFVVGAPADQRYLRILTLPTAEEVAQMLARLDT